MQHHVKCFTKVHVNGSYWILKIYLLTILKVTYQFNSSVTKCIWTFSFSSVSLNCYSEFEGYGFREVFWPRLCGTEPPQFSAPWKKLLPSFPTSALCRGKCPVYGNTWCSTGISLTGVYQPMPYTPNTHLSVMGDFPHETLPGGIGWCTSYQNSSVQDHISPGFSVATTLHLAGPCSSTAQPSVTNMPHSPFGWTRSCFLPRFTAYKQLISFLTFEKYLWFLTSPPLRHLLWF